MAQITSTKSIKELNKKLFYSVNIRNLLSLNLSNPSEKEQEHILRIIRKLKFDETEFLYCELLHNHILKGPIADNNNERRRKKRALNYISKISKISDPFIKQLPPSGKLCDIGCGTGVLTKGIFKNKKNEHTIYACDIINYLNPELKDDIHFKQKDAINYLKSFPSNYFDITMEIVILHHLSSKAKFKQCLKEMIRVTKKGGFILLVETVHTNWQESLHNHILDKLLNDRTSRTIENFIPVPINLFSYDELLNELQKYNIKIVKKIKLFPHKSDPKYHTIIVAKIV